MIENSKMIIDYFDILSMHLKDISKELHYDYYDHFYIQNKEVLLKGMIFQYRHNLEPIHHVGNLFDN